MRLGKKGKYDTFFELIIKQRQSVQYQMVELQQTIYIVNFKCRYYETAKRDKQCKCAEKYET